MENVNEYYGRLMVMDEYATMALFIGLVVGCSIYGIVKLIQHFRR